MKDFDTLLSNATECLAEQYAFSYAQAVAVLTTDGRYYTTTMTDALAQSEECARQLSKTLQADNDTAITKLVCRWANGEVDVPSYVFRDVLCRYNTDNADALILLRGENGYIQKTIGQTMVTR